MSLDEAPSGSAVVSKTIISFVKTERLAIAGVVTEPSTYANIRDVTKLPFSFTTKQVDIVRTGSSNLNRSGSGSDKRSSMRKFARIDLFSFCPLPVMHGLRANNLEFVAELRCVTTVFMKWDSYNGVKHRNLLELQDNFVCVQEVIYNAGGYIRQFLVDDKGCVLIACWGVPTSSFTDNLARALESCIHIHTNMALSGMICSFGITTGNVYCGCVGSEVRREYAVIGDVVNLAARLMSKAHGSIYIDENTYKAVTQSHRDTLQALEPMLVKGKDKPILAYCCIPGGDEAKGKSSSVLDSHIDTFFQADSRRKLALLSPVSQSRWQSTEEQPLVFIVVQGTAITTSIVFKYIQTVVKATAEDVKTLQVQASKAESRSNLKFIGKVLREMLKCINDAIPGLEGTTVLRQIFESTGQSFGFAVFIFHKVLGLGLGITDVSKSIYSCKKSISTIMQVLSFLF